MRILIFGGTTEGRMLAQTIAELHTKRHSVTVSVATDVGAQELMGVSGIKVIAGRLDEDEMVRLFLINEPGEERDGRADAYLQYDLIVDATHPYAVEASKNIRAAAARCGARCVRLLRADDEGEDRGGLSVYVESAASAAAYLAGTEGRILLTTGSKELGAFCEIPAERLYVRVLPTAESIAACAGAGIPYRNTIAMVGPFSREMNAATLRQYQIAWMVTKDSGKAGGFNEKIEACRETGVRPVVIARPRESGLTMAEVLRILADGT